MSRLVGSANFFEETATQRIARSWLTTEGG